jgi:hypothetical protein
VWQRQRFHDATCNICENDRYGGGSIMVWGGISRDGRRDLRVLERGKMTGVQHQDEGLNVYCAVGLMDYNARLHRARVVEQYL